MLTIDGSEGEGGGQILRTSIALALAAGTPVRITNIRKGRAKPGLLRQHLTAVRAAAEIGAAEVSGAELLSTEVVFRPTAIVPGAHTFAIGSAGSTTLVLQTVLPALLLAGAPSTITLEGGTHNPLAPPFEHLAQAFLPLVERMMSPGRKGAAASLDASPDAQTGLHSRAAARAVVDPPPGVRAVVDPAPGVRAVLVTPGFFPAGGGRLVIEVSPAATLTPLDLLERGELRRITGTALVASIPTSVALREMAAAREILGGDEASFRPTAVRGSAGPGNVVTITVESEHVTEVFTAFGERAVRAEAVGASAASEAKTYLEAGIPVGEHLADQLLLPMALAGRGSFRTLAPSSHTTTHADLLSRILGAKIHIERESEVVFRIEVRR